MKRLKKMNKYNNKKTTVDGITFDSELEADYYLYLKELKEKGEVIDFVLQPRYKICEGYTRNGKKIQPAYYVLDFEVLYKDNHIEYIDTKGFKTETSKLKRKLFESKTGNIVLWLTKNYQFGNSGGWIDMDELEKAIKNNYKKESAKNKKNNKRNMRRL